VRSDEGEVRILVISLEGTPLGGDGIVMKSICEDHREGNILVLTYMLVP